MNHNELEGFDTEILSQAYLQKGYGFKWDSNVNLSGPIDATHDGPDMIPGRRSLRRVLQPRQRGPSTETLGRASW